MSLDSAMRDLVREIVRDEIRPLREEMRSAVAASETRVTTDSSSPDLLTVEQVAAALKVTEATIRTWIKSGALRASRPSAGDKPGRVYRIWPADLEAFVAAAKSPGTGAETNIRAEAASIVALAAHRRKT